MGESTVNKETLAAGKHKKPERKQSIRDQTTMKHSAQVSNSTQQQRISTLSALATPY